MKRVLFLGLLALALPLAAFANSSTDFVVVRNGTLEGAGGTGVLSVSSATIDAVFGFNGGGLTQGTLGTLSFTTGAFISKVGAVSTFAAGGSFMITGSGTNGIPDGVIFSGTFSGPVTLTQMAFGNGPRNVYYALSCSGACSVTGTWLNTGKTVSGSFILQTNPGGSGIGYAYFSVQSPSAVPEAGTLSMLGTGLLGLGMLVRRRLKA